MVKSLWIFSRITGQEAYHSASEKEHRHWLHFKHSPAEVILYAFLCSHVLKSFPASEPLAVRENRVNPALMKLLRLRRAHRTNSFIRLTLAMWFLLLLSQPTQPVFCRGLLCAGAIVGDSFRAYAVSGLPVQTPGERDENEHQLSASMQRFTCWAELIPFISSWPMESHLLLTLSRPPQPGLNSSLGRAIQSPQNFSF